MGVQSPGLGKSPVPLAVTLKVQIHLELNMEAPKSAWSQTEEKIQTHGVPDDLSWNGAGLGNHLVQCLS